MQTVLGAGEEVGRDRGEQESVPGRAVAGYSCGGKWRVLFTGAEEERFVCSLFAFFDRGGGCGQIANSTRG